MNSATNMHDFGSDEEDEILLELKANNKKKMLVISNFEDVLNKVVGALGWWQASVFTLLFIPEFLFGALNLSVAFFQIRPPYACDVEGRGNWTIEQTLEISSPFGKKNERDPCHYYERPYSNLARISNFSNALATLSNDTNTTTCSKWIYNRTIDMEETLITQFDLVCDKKWYLEHSQMVYMFGFLFGSFTAGLLSDKFGRKSVFIISSVLASLFGIGQGYAPNYPIFLVFRFLLSCASIARTMGAFCMALEIITARYRVVFGGLFFLPYALGYAFLAPVAYWTKDWRTIHLALAAPGLVCVTFFWMMVESPRWLFVHGRIKQAEKAIKWAAMMNRKTIPEGLDFGQIAQAISDEEQRLTARRTTFFHIFKCAKDHRGRFYFKYPRLIGRTMNLFWNWIVNSGVYYGVSLNISSFVGDRFVNNAIAGAIEVPSYMLCVPLLYMGRKIGLFLMLALAGITLFTIPWLPEMPEDPVERDGYAVDYDKLRLACVMLGKLGITASFQLVYVFTTELYPTVIRNSGLSTSSCVARLGSIAAPYISGISKLNKDVAFVPMLIFGVCSLSAALLTLILPETKGMKLPEHLDDGIVFEPEKKIGPSERTQNQEVKF